MHTGRCLCGAVSFEVAADLKAPDACHCTMCRRVSGHYWASTNVKRGDFTLHGEDHVRWYQSTDKVRRGFCDTCGSALFWDPVEHPIIAIAMGAFDKPTSTHLEMHIFTADKGDYYTIADGLPQNPQ